MKDKIDNISKLSKVNFKENNSFFNKLKKKQPKYLIIDKDNDYVLKQSPCDFLNDDNTCFIYDHRPKACREYPHTNRKNFHKISQITLKNIEICPATFNIVEKLKLILKNNS